MILYYRRDRKERNNDKDRLKKLKEDVDDEHYWSRDSSRSNRKPSSNIRPGFRHDPNTDRLHNEHDRWNSGQPRERFPTDHKRDRYDYQRLGSNYHRERDHMRLGDKRQVYHR